jgi:hypothetical protein
MSHNQLSSYNVFILRLFASTCFKGNPSKRNSNSIIQVTVICLPSVDNDILICFAHVSDDTVNAGFAKTM